MTSIAKSSVCCAARELGPAGEPQDEFIPSFDRVRFKGRAQKIRQDPGVGSLNTGLRVPYGRKHVRLHYFAEAMNYSSRPISNTELPIETEPNHINRSR